MGLIRIEGKEVSLDDAIIDAGIPAIRAALSVDFPDVENADIQIVTPTRAGAPKAATVVKRSTGKGANAAMRSRVEIENQFDADVFIPKWFQHGPALRAKAEKLQLEVLLDIRDLLISMRGLWLVDSAMSEVITERVKEIEVAKDERA